MFSVIKEPGLLFRGPGGLKWLPKSPGGSFSASAGLLNSVDPGSIFHFLRQQPLKSISCCFTPILILLDSSFIHKELCNYIRLNWVTQIGTHRLKLISHIQGVISVRKCSRHSYGDTVGHYSAHHIR